MFRRVRVRDGGSDMYGVNVIGAGVVAVVVVVVVVAVAIQVFMCLVPVVGKVGADIFMARTLGWMPGDECILLLVVQE
jgi:hypothetical protein